MVKYSADPSAPSDVEAVFSALANPTRRSILEDLRAGPRSISELAEPFDMSLVGVSKHVHRLEDAGLLRIHRQGRTRYCRLEPGPLRAGDRWIGQFRSFWTDELEQVDRYLRAGGTADDEG